MQQSSPKLISMPHNQLYDSHVKHLNLFDSLQPIWDGYPLWVAKHMFNFNPPKTSYTAQKWRGKKKKKEEGKDLH